MDDSTKSSIDTCASDTSAVTNDNGDTSEKPKNKLAVELLRLREKDELKAMREKRRVQREVRKVKKRFDKERKEKGIELYPETAESKAVIMGIKTSEEEFALEKDKKKLDSETNMLKREIDDKIGALLLENRPDLTSLADNLFSQSRGNPNVPDHINSSLTTAEIEDLRLVFDMFDMKGKGYINASDLKRIIHMLGFRAPKKVLDGMISELAGDTERVTFMNFLEFIVTSQGDGPDPFDEISQAFSLIDGEQKDFFTMEDLRRAVDESKLSFSNSMLKEMMEEADKTGDGKISRQEFTDIMTQTSVFKLASSPSRISKKS